MSALGVPQTKIFLGAYFALALYFAVSRKGGNMEVANTAIDMALPQYFLATFLLSLLVAILANTSVLKWYHVAIYAIALEILGRLIKRKKDGDLGSRIDIIRGFTSGWALVALIVYLRSQST
jgi:hypothetical protein